MCAHDVFVVWTRAESNLCIFVNNLFRDKLLKQLGDKLFKQFGELLYKQFEKKLLKQFRKKVQTL